MKLTPEERGRDLLDPRTLSLAVQQVRTNGYVVFEGLLPPELLGELRTAFPGSEHQAVHSDIRLLFPDSDLRVPAYCVVLNIPLVDFREDMRPSRSPAPRTTVSPSAPGGFSGRKESRNWLAS